MVDFWITDVDYGADGNIERYGMIVAPVASTMIGGREASAKIFVSPTRLEAFIDAGNGVFTTRKSRDGRLVMRGPSLEPRGA